MDFAKELLGGVLIIIVAGLVGLAQNVARDDSVPLVPKSSLKPTQTAPSPEPTAVEEVAKEEDSRAEPTEGFETTAPDWPTEAELASGELSKERLRVLMDAGNIIIIDARSEAEFSAGHIAGAINIPYDGLIAYYDKLREMIPLDAMVVCYCESITCDESENLAKELGFMGYTNVIVYKGGWQEWQTTDYPTEGTQTTE